MKMGFRTVNHGPRTPYVERFDAGAEDTTGEGENVLVRYGRRMCAVNGNIAPSCGIIGEPVALRWKQST